MKCPIDYRGDVVITWKDGQLASVKGPTGSCKPPHQLTLVMAMLAARLPHHAISGELRLIDLDWPWMLTQETLESTTPLFGST